MSSLHLLLGLALSASTPSQPAASICAGLSSDLDTVERNLARTWARFAEEGEADSVMYWKSVETQLLLSGQMTISLMQSHSCPLPAHPPRPNDYITNAALCQLEVLKQPDVDEWKLPACDLKSWTRQPGQHKKN